MSSPVCAAAWRWGRASTEVVAALHRDVDLVMSWPVNTSRALDAALAIGVSGVISDETTVLEDVMRRRAAP